MFVFLGSYSGGGGGGSSDDDDSQDEGSTDDQAQTGIDDFGGDGEEDDDSDSGAAAAGAAGAAGAAAGAASGAASGAGAGAGAVVEPPGGEDPEECEDEEESEPGSPEIEEPDLEELETEPEDDIDDPETEEEYDFDESDDVEEDTEEEEDADEEDEEDEDETVVVVQEVDALSAMSWGVQPVMKRVEECYGEDVGIFYKPAPVREIDPEQEKQKWRDIGQQLSMPVDPSFWDEDPPESTELVNKAFEAAIQQYRGEDYIRALWRRGVAAGRDINDRGVLIDLASDLGLDRERFEEDIDEVELESGERNELPFTFMEIQGKPVPKNGRVRYTDFKTQFTFQGIDEQSPQDLQGFVEEHGPVATPEVIEVYGIQHGEIIHRHRCLNNVSSFEIGGEDFWYLSGSDI